MRMGLPLGCLVLSIAAAHAADDASLERAAAAQALPALTQKLCDAVAPGDKATWQHYLSGKFAVTDESGVRDVQRYLSYVRDEARVRWGAGMNATLCAPRRSVKRIRIRAPAAPASEFSEVE